METTVKKQDVKVEKKNVAKEEYVKLLDMGKDDILSLPKYRANLIKQKSRRGQVFYRLVIELDPLLKIEKVLTETEFNLIVLERKLSFDKPIQGILVPGRLIYGTSESGKEWSRFEMFVSKNFIAKDFLNDTQMSLIKAAELKLPFIESSEKYSDEELFKAFDYYE